MACLRLDRLDVVVPGPARYPLGEQVFVTGLESLAATGLGAVECGRPNRARFVGAGYPGASLRFALGCDHASLRAVWGGRFRVAGRCGHAGEAVALRETALQWGRARESAEKEIGQ